MNYWNEKERDRLLNSSIQNARDSNLKLNVKIIGTKCCTECDEINGTIVSLEEYLNNPILPYHRCTRHSLPNPPHSATFCICTLGFEPLRDSNGRLIDL